MVDKVSGLHGIHEGYAGGHTEVPVVDKGKNIA